MKAINFQRTLLTKKKVAKSSLEGSKVEREEDKKVREGWNTPDVHCRVVVSYVVVKTRGVNSEEKC